MDDEAEISSGTDTDEDGALIEKARQAAEQKRAPPRKRGPTSGSLCCASSLCFVGTRLLFPVTTAHVPQQ